MTLEITRFRPADQAAVRRLILDGLEEHWGSIDPELNPDLDDIVASYGHGTVLVARVDGRVVGVGMLLPAGQDEGEVKRMSVAREHRRTGVASAVLRRLVDAARLHGWRGSSSRRPRPGPTPSSSTRTPASSSPTTTRAPSAAMPISASPSDAPCRFRRRNIEFREGVTCMNRRAPAPKSAGR